MEISEIESENVSFLALLMAPDNSTIENPYEPQTSPDSFQTFPSLAYTNRNLNPPVLDHHHNTSEFPQILSHDNNYFLPPLPPLPEFTQTPDVFCNFNPFSDTDYFSALPELLSLETLPKPPPLKCPKIEPSPQPLQPQVDGYSLESIINECIRKTDEKKRSQATAQKTKRVRIRDKIYELSKLMPAGYGRKKTMVEMLEDAYKYVKFLHAQVSALECMPAVSRLGEGGGRGIGRLGRLTRQQMLQVAVISPEAQMVMAEKGWCVVSAEQVAQLKRAEMRKKVVQRLLAHIPI